MLVVLDANIVISALITPAGIARRVVLAGIEGRYDFAVCPMLLAELKDTSKRPRIANLVPVGVAELLFADVRGAARTEPDPDFLPISRDPRDDYLVALASSVGADHLVTGDADLLDIAEPPMTITTLRTVAGILDL